MRVLGRLGALLTALAAGVLLTLACSNPAPGEPKKPNPTAILRQAGQSTGTLRSLKADVKFGPGVTLQGFTLSSATSTLQAPDQSDTTFKVKQGDFLVDVRVVSIGGHVYLRLPFSRFQELTPDEMAEVPDLGKLLDSRTGLGALLAEGRDPAYQGSENVRGAACDKVTATYTAEQIGRLFGGAAPQGDVRATVWAGQSDHFVHRVVLSGPLLEAGKDVEVQVDLHDFNQPVTIASPSTGPVSSPTGG